MTKNKLTLIKRTSPICPQCTIMQSMLDGAELEYDVIDIAEDSDAIEKYNLSSVPVILIGDVDGENMRLNGVQPIEVIQEFLD